MTFLWPKRPDESSIVPTESTERQENLCKERRSGIDDESACWEVKQKAQAILCAAKGL
jgi:hypothetical protein